MNKNTNEPIVTETEETQIHDEIASIWSDIDATSIYRSGGTPLVDPSNKNKINQIEKNAKSFFKLGSVIFVILLVIIFISKNI